MLMRRPKIWQIWTLCKCSGFQVFITFYSFKSPNIFSFSGNNILFYSFQNTKIFSFNENRKSGSSGSADPSGSAEASGSAAAGEKVIVKKEPKDATRKISTFTSFNSCIYFQHFNYISSNFQNSGGRAVGKNC